MGPVGSLAFCIKATAKQSAIASTPKRCWPAANDRP